MKKVLLTIASLVAVAMCANAQVWAWGPKVGATFSTANGVTDAKARAGVVAGMFAESAVNDWLVMEADLLFSQQGYDLDTSPKDRFRADYLTMPIVGKYYLLDGLNFQMGAQFGYLLGVKEKVGDTKRQVRDEFNKYSISFIAGLAYDFDFGMIIECRYHYGLTPMVTSNSNSRGGHLQVMLGWRF